MGDISGSKRLEKRMARVCCGLPRQQGRYVVAGRPGPRARGRAVPVAVLLRDMLGVVSTLREAKTSVYAGKVKVDGVTRKSLHHGVGLMDVVELDGVEGAYRMVPSGGALLAPVPAGEPARKLVRVTSKTTIRGGRTQLGFHDGRSVIHDGGASVGDTCLIEVPGQKILDTVALESGCLCLVTSGANAGQTGRVKSIEKGTFILPRRAVLELEGREIEIPTGIIRPVGREGPLVGLA